MSIEQELVERALAGNGDAFAELVRPHLPMLYRIAARVCYDRALAEDAVQEALTLAYRKLDRYKPDTSLKAFLGAFAARRAQTILRGERRRRLREDASHSFGTVHGPAELLQAQYAADRIRDALAKMPKKRREAALLKLDGQLSYAEIAAAVKSTEGSARVLVHLAMKDLREKLGDLVGSAPKQEAQ